MSEATIVKSITCACGLQLADVDVMNDHLKSTGHMAPLAGPTTYSDLGRMVGNLVEKKQAAYGDSFGKSGDVMRLLYPEGIKPAAMTDALGVVRVVDKLFRIATDRDALGESPWRDIAGYGLLGAANAEKKQ